MLFRYDDCEEGKEYTVYTSAVYNRKHRFIFPLDDARDMFYVDDPGSSIKCEWRPRGDGEKLDETPQITKGRMKETKRNLVGKG